MGNVNCLVGNREVFKWILFQKVCTITYLVSLNYTMHQKWKNLINVENPSSNLHMLRFTKLMKNKGRMQVHFILDETQVFLNKMNETNLTKKNGRNAKAVTPKLYDFICIKQLRRMIYSCKLAFKLLLEL